MNDTLHESDYNFTNQEGCKTQYLGYIAVLEFMFESNACQKPSNLI